MKPRTAAKPTIPRICGTATCQYTRAQLAPSTAAASNWVRSMLAMRAMNSRTVKPTRFHSTTPRTLQIAVSGSRSHACARPSSPTLRSRSFSGPPSLRR
jgi:hypothetical protein